MGIFKEIYLKETDKNDKYYVEPEEFQIVPIKGLKYGCKMLDGCLLPMLVKNLSLTKDLKLRDDDTFVIGFPKSGTTWVEEIVWLLKNNLDFHRAKSEEHFARVIFIDEGHSKSLYDMLSSPRVFKSHMPIKFLPENFHKKAKVIYVLRNPKDMLVSLYFFQRDFKLDQFIGTFEEMCKMFVQGETPYGPWWDHIDQYTSLEGIHVVHYEDLLKNPVKHSKELAEYLGVSLNEDQVKSLVSFVSFENMKNNEKAFNLKDEEIHFEKSINFFRKGQVGNWRCYFTEELSRQIDDVVDRNLNYKKLIKY